MNGGRPRACGFRRRHRIQCPANGTKPGPGTGSSVGRGSALDFLDDPAPDHDGIGMGGDGDGTGGIANAEPDTDRQRNVTPEYTNIALMSAFLQEWVGATLSKPEIAANGAAKARQVAALFNRFHTFTEDNSPTYGGVDAMGLALWRELSPSPESKKAARAMEASFWRDTVQLYHAGLRNLCGPFTRAYGMDMVQYTAITGVAILLLTQDKKTAPAPSDWHNRSFEWAYVPMFLALGLRCPPDALAHFKVFDKPRRLERKVPRAGKIYPLREAAAALEESKAGHVSGKLVLAL